MRNLFLGIVLSILSITALASKDLTTQHDIIQSIQVINLLANTELPNPGMTPTPVIIKYYNGRSEPCWISKLNYQDDTTIHVGPWMGCVNKVTELVVTPVIVADKLKTYQSQLTIPVDLTKYSTQITLVQDEPPTFDTQSGLVIKSGSFKVKMQSLSR